MLHWLRQRLCRAGRVLNTARDFVRGIALLENGFFNCAECHNAGLSTKSSDILLPKLKAYLKHHGRADELKRVPTTCVTCHDFYLEGLPSMVGDSSMD